MQDIRPDLPVSEFLDCLEERADKNFKKQLHQPLVDWYIEAEIGHLKWEFTDGPNDGGIDAVVWRRPEDKPLVIILQSKRVQKLEAATPELLLFFTKLQTCTYRSWAPTCACQNPSSQRPGLPNLNYLLLKAQRLAITKTEFIVLRRAA